MMLKNCAKILTAIKGSELNFQIALEWVVINVLLQSKG